MSGTLRVVLDTNLVLSALVFPRGRVATLRRAWQDHAFLTLVCRETADELIRVLAYPKFRLTAAEQETLLADYLPCCQTVELPTPRPPVPECRDPHDLPFLWLAVRGQADVLVSADDHLLSLTGQLPCSVLTADAFLRTLDSGGATKHL